MRCEPRSRSSSPSARMPVPASSTRKPPSSSSETSTQDVSPPYSTVSGPGAGTEPRQPQTVTRIQTSILGPEDRDDADELVCVCEEREGGHGNLAVDPVTARDPKSFVRGAALVEGDPRRSSFSRNGLRIGRSGREARHPLVER